MAQMKEQKRTPEKELNNEEIANLSDEEFKTLVINCWQDVSSHNQKGTTTNLKTKNKNCQKIELKSDNQGVKEETFIQTGRRGGDGQPG